MRNLLTGASFTREERALLDEAELPLQCDSAGERAMVLLYWLRYITGYVAQYPDRARDKAWVRQDVASVLQCL